MSIMYYIRYQNVIFFKFDFPVLWLLLLFVDDKSTTSLPKSNKSKRLQDVHTRYRPQDIRNEDFY